MGLKFIDYADKSTVATYSVGIDASIPRVSEAIVINGIKWQVVSVTHTPRDSDQYLSDIDIVIDAMQPRK